MKSERLKGLSATTTKSYNYYTSFSVQTLPRQNDCTDFSTTADESDVEDYYPFVIGRGKSFKIIDPKVYKQLRKNNIHQTKNIRIAECAKKASSATKMKETQRFHSTTSGTESEDEYCELSPLAKAPSPVTPPRKLQQLDIGSKATIKKVTGCEKRYSEDFYKAKPCIVQSSLNSDGSKVITRLLNSTDVTGKALWKGSESSSEKVETNELSRTRLCGLDAEEAVDCATCMCCVKGLFYHCTKDSEDEGMMADDPCSCSGPLKTCLPRWGCLAVLSLFLPCMWCYLPVAGCRKVSSCISCKKKKSDKCKSSKKVKKLLTS